MRDITELPHDLFLLVLTFLSPRACVRCRAVSRRWHAAFTSDFVSQLLLRWNYPRCRELRLASAVAAGAAAVSPSSTTTSSKALARNLQAELVDLAKKPRSWSSTFTEVARRYFHLNTGQPGVVEKLELAASGEGESAFSFWGVAPWNRFLRLGEKTSNFQYPDPAWWYSQEDGVLVYPAAVHASDNPLDCAPGNIYRLVDLDTGQGIPFPFDVRSKHIRRVRLAQGVLIFEWAEALPYHQLNDREVVHRHYVTAFNVVRRPSKTVGESAWTVEFRSEWKLHFLGLPLNRSDRFFSTHTATHYAVYFWQPNRSLYQDDPIEQLAIWDISSPSPYRPSEDPTGDKRPVVARTPSTPTGLWNGKSNASATGRIDGPSHFSAALRKPEEASLATATAGPQVIRRMAWRDLDFYGLRQRATPRLMGLALDSRNLYVMEEEHRLTAGQHSSLNPPRAHFVRSTAIPVIPVTPSFTQGTNLMVTRSASDLDSKVDRRDRTSATLSNIVDGPVNGPTWVDSCGVDSDVNMSFCQCLANVDTADDSNTKLETWRGPEPVRASLDHLSDQLPPRSSTNSAGWSWALGDTDFPSPLASTRSTRWPGWAPCWRHKDFPYLTVAEMADFAAGVRITARRCFVLESVSMHIRPTVAVGIARRRSNDLRATFARNGEVYLPDQMWSELVAKGYIAGDERWIIGEDEKGRVTIVRF